MLHRSRSLFLLLGSLAYRGSLTRIADNEMCSMDIHEKRHVRTRLSRSCSRSPQDQYGKEQTIYCYTA